LARRKAAQKQEKVAQWDGGPRGLPSTRKVLVTNEHLLHRRHRRLSPPMVNSGSVCRSDAAASAVTALPRFFLRPRHLPTKGTSSCVLLIVTSPRLLPQSRCLPPPGSVRRFLLNRAATRIPVPPATSVKASPQTAL